MALASRARVSVVLPVFNRAAYVGEAIESVLAQTLPPDELIVVDDGSTDDSVAIAEAFSRPSLRVLRQENAGIGAARNRGLAAATGDLIAFIDSDDVWERDKLELEARAMSAREEVDLVFGHLVEFLSPEREEELAGSLRFAADPVPGLIASTLLARRGAVERIGPFDEHLRVGEFVEWMARARDLGLVRLVLPDVVARRRIHGQNTVLTRGSSDYLRAIKSTLDRRRARAAHAG
ncbi:MAG TPA: glycosyltransferase family A protein [Candidatus Binatia bacterium]|nr:glycosyltransferase family A protein [Candidatus Binatia bacterium]